MEGKVPNNFAIEMHFPELMKSKLGFTKVLWETGELSMDEIQHVGILICKANNCLYCTGAFCNISRRTLSNQPARFVTSTGTF